MTSHSHKRKSLLSPNLGGLLTKVIAKNDSLDGKIIGSEFSSSSLFINREALSGNQIVFRAEFTDGSQGIYVATATPASVPESSSTLSVLAIGTLGAGSVLRRKWKSVSRVKSQI